MEKINFRYCVPDLLLCIFVLSGVLAIFYIYYEVYRFVQDFIFSNITQNENAIVIISFICIPVLFFIGGAVIGFKIAERNGEALIYDEYIEIVLKYNNSKIFYKDIVDLQLYGERTGNGRYRNAGLLMYTLEINIKDEQKDSVIKIKSSYGDWFKGLWKNKSQIPFEYLSTKIVEKMELIKNNGVRANDT
ncbi:hypothetical protein FACS1894130_12900 [Spirochaetia bacterium]|nr:hypothetical protein FACS1894130_12900 [Spirochaetia bacterium]